MEPSGTHKDQIKYKFTLIIMNWIRLHFQSNNDYGHQFPLDIIQLVINVFLYSNILQFNEEFKHPNIELLDDKRCAS